MADAPKDPGAQTRTSMAAERTWLAWWRAALGASIGALGVGRVAPEALHVARGPYVVLGIGYGLVAIGLLVVGANRQRGLQRAAERGTQAPMPFWLVAVFTCASVVLATMTIVLVLVNS